MFQLTFIALITLRVIFCPVLCMGCGEAARANQTADDQAVESRGCCGSDSTPCQDGNSQAPSDAPHDCPCPCESGDCQVIIDLTDRTVVTDSVFEVTVEVLPVSYDTLIPSQRSGSRGVGRSHRLDLTSGWSVRLAHASLLL